MNHQIQAVVTLLALINPFVCASIFMRLESGQSRGTQVKTAGQAAIAVWLILSLAALIGTKLLHAFGISLDAFSVAGGAVLAWLGFSMISRMESSDGPPNKNTPTQPSVAPLVLFAASPGTITGVITLAAAHSQRAFPVNTLIAVGLGVAVMYVTLLAATFAGGHQSSTGSGIARDIFSRLMGLIVLAMGVQFALTGLRAFFAN